MHTPNENTRELTPLSLRIKLETLRCIHQKNERKGTEAYLWVIFFKAGGQKLHITESFRLEGNAEFKFSSGSHGNLGEQPFKDGDTYKPRPDVGEWKTTLHPLLLPHFEANITGVTGCLTVLMEKKNLTLKGAEAAHQFLNQYVDEAVKGVIAGFDPRLIDVNNLVESVKNYFTSQLTSLAQHIEEEIVEEVQKSQTLLQNLWSLIGPDRLIGYHLWVFSHESILSAGGRETFKDQIRGKSHENWEVSGFVEVINEADSSPSAVEDVAEKPESEIKIEIDLPVVVDVAFKEEEL